MASVVSSEKWASINSDEFENIEVSEINSTFLLSLIEELQDHVEESDEERLKIMIQSLEAEINSSIAIDHDRDSCVGLADPGDEFISVGEDSQTSNSGQLDGHDCSALFDDLDMDAWIDMEEVLPCSPSDAMNLCMYNCGDERSNGSFAHTYLEVALDQENAHNDLWKETTY